MSSHNILMQQSRMEKFMSWVELNKVPTNTQSKQIEENPNDWTKTILFMSFSRLIFQINWYKSTTNSINAFDEISSKGYLDK
jgi:hypothetical protein